MTSRHKDSGVLYSSKKMAQVEYGWVPSTPFVKLWDATPLGRLAHIIRRAFPPSLHASLDVVVQFDEYGRVAGYQRPTQSNYGQCGALHHGGGEGVEIGWEGSTERSSTNGSSLACSSTPCTALCVPGAGQRVSYALRVRLQRAACPVAPQASPGLCTAGRRAP